MLVNYSSVMLIVAYLSQT